MHRTLKISGLLAPSLMLIIACGGEQTEALNQADQGPAIADSLDRAMADGRLGMIPQATTTTVVASDAAVIDARSEALAGEKSADPWLRPQASYADEGMRQIELSGALDPSPGFELTLELDRTDYMLGEPIFARTVLSNVSDQTLRVAPLADPQYTYGHLVIETPSGDVLGMKPIAQLCSRGELQVEDMLAGDSRTEDFPVFFGSQGYLFEEAGTYKVQLMYRGITEDSARVDSNPVFITIHEGDEDAQDAAALAMDGEAGLFMMWGEGDHLRRGIGNLELLLELYPDSPIADSARFALGRNLSVDFTDYSVNALREARPAAARAYLEPLVADLKAGHAVLEAGRTRDAFFLLAQDYASLGENGLARATVGHWLDAFGSDAPAVDVLKARDLLSSF